MRHGQQFTLLPYHEENFAAYSRRSDPLPAPDEVVVRIADSGYIGAAYGPDEQITQFANSRMIKYVRAGMIIKNEKLQYRMLGETNWTDCVKRDDVEYRLKP